MDWGTILTSVITALIMGAGSIFIFFIFFKQRKKKEDIDVIDKDASVAKNMLGFTTDYQNFVKQMSEKYQSDIKENKEEVASLRVEVTELNSNLKQLKTILNDEYIRRKYAENNLCLVTDCKLRVPELGAFKSDNNIDLIELLK